MDICFVELLLFTYSRVMRFSLSVHHQLLLRAGRLFCGKMLLLKTQPSVFIVCVSTDISGSLSVPHKLLCKWNMKGATVFKGLLWSVSVCGCGHLNHLTEKDQVCCGPAGPECGDNCCSPCSSALFKLSVMFFCELEDYLLDIYIDHSCYLIVEMIILINCILSHTWLNEKTKPNKCSKINWGVSLNHLIASCFPFLCVR